VGNDMGVTAQPKADVLDAVRKVQPRLAANADAGEERRWIVDENIRLLEEAGLFSMVVPERFGGTDRPLDERVAAIAAVAEACPSTAWAVALWLGNTWVATLYRGEAQEELFEPAHMRVAGVLSPTGTLTPVEGGYLLSGEWRWNTGCRGAHWDGLTGIVKDPGRSGPPEMRYCLVPVDQVTFHDDWHAMGAAATGSSRTSADGVFVPAERTMRVSDLLANVPQPGASVVPGRRYSFFSHLMVISIGPFVGMARGALNRLLERVPGRGITYTPWSDQAQHPGVQIKLARAAGKVEAAEAMVGKMVDLLQARADSDSELSVAERAWIKGTIGLVVELTRESVELVWSMAGASAAMKNVEIQRFFRDMQTLALHAVMFPDANFETYGRTLVGLDPGTPFV
jgi:alkylation response protein AidB-like acyl-CoA dehydrogenase